MNPQGKTSSLCLSLGKTLKIFWSFGEEGIIMNCLSSTITSLHIFVFSEEEQLEYISTAVHFDVHEFRKKGAMPL